MLSTKEMKIKIISDLHHEFGLSDLDALSAAYASNLEDVILEHQPLYWIHGHIHTLTRYTIGNTEIICNPHGYLNEKYNGYEKDLIIEI